MALGNGDIKIVQIVTEQPVGPLAHVSRHPYLFGLDETGLIFFWNWSEKIWVPIDQIDETY